MSFDVNSEIRQFYAYLLSFRSNREYPAIYLTKDSHLPKLRELFEKYNINICFFPSIDAIPYINSVPPIENIKTRIETIRKILRNKSFSIVSSIKAVSIKTISQQVIEKEIVISLNQYVDIQKLKNNILEMGYERVEKVIDYGEVAFKGSVIDIFPPDYSNPVRITFDFDEVSSIKVFDPETQISISKLDKIVISSPFENEISSLFKKNSLNVSLLDILENFNIFSFIPLEEVEKEYYEFVEESKVLFEKSNEKDNYIPPSQLFSAMPRIEEVKLNVDVLSPFSTEELTPNYSVVIKYVSSLLNRKKVIFLSPADKYTNRIRSILEKYNVPFVVISEYSDVFEFISGIDVLPKGKLIVIEKLHLPVGFETEEFVVLTTKEFFNKEFVEYESVVSDISSEEIKDIYFFENIQEGDYIVHSNYGIGIFRGIKEINYFGKVKEFASIEYEGGDILYIPPEQFNLISKYIGSEQPKISSLKQKNWKSVKQKVRESILKFSRDLLRLKALRQIQKKEPLRVDFEEYRLLEDSFPYEETPDQIKVMEEIKLDIASGKVMDRIVCGDVGFGKTEIAIRTAYLHILNGNQVMVLVPTTILAEQHYKTFSQRLSPFGVRLGIISRLRKDSEIKKTLQELETGSIDLLIGTHALITEKGAINKFKKLGLIIIDEEHKFGVEHKESILKSREDVDVLMLSATPIPRSLGMGLSNLKDISLITTPPFGRKPIKTFIIEWNKEVIKDAIERELRRNGQVLIVNDKIKGIDSLKDSILEICSGILSEDDVCVLHGQLSKDEIEEIFFNFVEKKYKVMISTTISESGLDLPSVNTIIVNNAHLFGLADLHQLRGRVGRRDVEGYAYFVYPSRYIISELQMKRLSTIEEHSDLGAGFRIALKDLELRGAGNLLGKEQHGNIKTVGYVFYVRMLSETLRLLGEGLNEEEVIDYSDPVVYLSFDKIFDDDDIPNSEKMEIMLKLNVATTEKQINYIINEIKDRYGKVPSGIFNLTEVVKFRLQLRRFFVEEVYETDKGITIRFHKNHLPDGEKIIDLITQGRYEIEMIPNDPNALLLKVFSDDVKEKTKEILKFLEDIFDLE